MLVNVLFFLFFVLLDVFLGISILSVLSLSLYYWLYERDIIEYEFEEDDPRK